MSSLALTLLYLLAAVLGVVVCRSLKLPPMLGYLAAGVLIGPHALALAQNSSSVRHLGEFGVVLMVGGNIEGETRTLSVDGNTRSFLLARPASMPPCLPAAHSKPWP